LSWLILDVGVFVVEDGFFWFGGVGDDEFVVFVIV